MAFQTYRAPYNAAEKEAYKAGIKKGRQLAIDEGQVARAPTNTPSERSASALERIAAVLEYKIYPSENAEKGGPY